MASVSALTVQSSFSSHNVSFARTQMRPNLIRVPSSLSFPSLHNNKSSMRIRCMSEENKVGEQQPPTTANTTGKPLDSFQSQSSSPSPPPPRTPKVSTKFGDVLAFSGPAPERINGRLAMIGFVSAIVVELARGEDVVSQITDGGISSFVVVSVILSLASLIPLFKGVSVDSKSDGIMTSNAELWNGRFAMLGLVALVFTEFVKGGALI